MLSGVMATSNHQNQTAKVSLHLLSRARQPPRFARSSPLSKGAIVSGTTSGTCATQRPPVKAGGLTCVAPGRRRRARCNGSPSLRFTTRRDDDSAARQTTRTQRLWQVTQCRRSRWPSVCKTWTFSLSPGALERMESRHSLFTKSMTFRNASHIKSSRWV